MGVLEVVVAGEDHHHGVGQVFVDIAGELESVDKGHADVGDQHVGHKAPLELFDRLPPVAAADRRVEAVLGPADRPEHRAQNLKFILRKHDFVHVDACAFLEMSISVHFHVIGKHPALQENFP